MNPFEPLPPSELFLHSIHKLYKNRNMNREIKNYYNFTTDMAGRNMAGDLNEMVELCHSRSVSAGWYTNLKTGEPLERNVGEMLCLIHSEVSEAMEGHRKNLMDDKLPHRKMVEVELADALIRIFDLAGYLGCDLGGAVSEKLEYNANRADHKPENRVKDGGKQF